MSLLEWDNPIISYPLSNRPIPRLAVRQT